MAVKELDNLLTEMANRAHLKVELRTGQMLRATPASQIGLLPRFVIASLKELELLGQVAPHVVVLSNPLAIPARLIESLEVICGQELQRLLQGEPHDFLKKR